MSAPQQALLTSIRDPDVEGGRLLTTVLQKNCIPCVLWAVSAAVHYGGGLCPLDIEIAINASDQQRVFEILSSHGLSISSPDHQSAPPSSFEEWFKNAPSSSQFHDRRRTRLLTPIYELPATGNPLDDMLRPFIIVYSAEEVGLPLISPPTSSTETKPTEAYITLSVLNPDLALCNNAFSSRETHKAQVMDSMIPSFTSLVKSEMHVLLMHAEVHSPVWGQHMAQLSELVYSRACADGPDNLQEVVANASFKEFISWFRASLKGEADYETLEGLRASYREVYQLQDDQFSGSLRCQ